MFAMMNSHFFNFFLKKRIARLGKTDDSVTPHEVSKSTLSTKTIAVAKIIQFVNNQFGFKKLSCITTRQALKMLLLSANVFGGGLSK